MTPCTRNGSNPQLDDIGPPSGAIALLDNHSDVITPRPEVVRVPGVKRDIEVNLAIELSEQEEAFTLVSESYRARGYESPHSHGLRFTPYHTLPDTAVFVAKREGRVVATLSVVPDNWILGLPMECIYGEEVNALRGDGYHLCEVTSLADRDLTLREFLPVFVTLSRCVIQYSQALGGDIWVITINPRHRAFYRKVMGFVPFGPRRCYPSVQNHPAEAYKMTAALIRVNAPNMHQRLFEERVPAEALRGPRMTPNLARYFAACSISTDIQTVEEILKAATLPWGARRWW
jgi:hypothetical protein